MGRTNAPHNQGTRSRGEGGSAERHPSSTAGQLPQGRAPGPKNPRAQRGRPFSDAGPAPGALHRTEATVPPLHLGRQGPLERSAHRYALAEPRAQATRPRVTTPWAREAAPSWPAGLWGCRAGHWAAAHERPKTRAQLHPAAAAAAGLPPATSPGPLSRREAKASLAWDPGNSSRNRPAASAKT